MFQVAGFLLEAECRRREEVGCAQEWSAPLCTWVVYWSGDRGCVCNPHYKHLWATRFPTTITTFHDHVQDCHHC